MDSPGAPGVEKAWEGPRGPLLRRVSGWVGPDVGTVCLKNCEVRVSLRWAGATQGC